MVTKRITKKSIKKIDSSKKVLVLRTCNKDMTACNNFMWPKKGPVKCEDWNPEPVCGQGLHGLLWGIGDGSLLNWEEEAKWLVVEVDEDKIVSIENNKVKFPEGSVVYCGDREGAVELLVKAGADQSRMVCGQASASGDYGQASASGYQGQASASGYRGQASASGDYGQASASGDYGQASASGYQGQASASGYQGQASASGYQGQASASGYQGQASASGDYGQASASGTRGQASASGDYGQASASGTRGQASASGTRGQASASGYQGQASASGDYGQASASGYQGQASASGDYGQASASGTRGQASASGYQGQASASELGTIILCWFDGTRYRTVVLYVGEDGIEPNTFYMCDQGKIIKGEKVKAPTDNK